MAERDSHRYRADRTTDELARAYRDAQRLIAAELRVALATGNEGKATVKRAALASVLQVLDRLGVETDPLARQALREAWDESVDLTADRIAKLGVTVEPAFEFGAVSETAVRTMQDAMVDRLAQARRTVGRRVEDVFAKAARREVMLGLLGASGSRRKVSGRLVESLRAQGIKSFTDKAGREWALDRYAEMVARTTTREAVVEAAITRMTSQGVSVARVSRSGNPCPICIPWQDRLVSLDGQTTEVNGEPVATLGAMPNGGPPFHPRCAHTLYPEAVTIQALRRELAGAAA